MTKTYIKKPYFIATAIDCGKDPEVMLEKFHTDGHKIDLNSVKLRLKKFILKGYIPLDSGNSVSKGEILKGTSTLYGTDGAVKMQWVKSDVDQEVQIAAIETAVKDIIGSITPIPNIPAPATPQLEEFATLYISNDVHLGLLTEEAETGQQWNLDSGVQAMKSAYDYLFSTSPSSKIGIIADLGDLTEADGYRNSTSKSGNPLDLSNRYPVVLRAAYESFIYAINLALLKHEVVHFINVGGNHDNANGIAIQEIIRQTFKENPRVIVDDTAYPIKYHQHGQVLLGFAHGDMVKMNRIGETMAVDCQSIFSETNHRFAHMGHTHVDSVRDGAICKVESHRNLPPQNHWAQSAGYRRGVGTMKSITYDSTLGEVSRSTFNLIH